ncbi:MAG: dipZ [Firmicutes bacterium]|nr:dipZ [Bacillota bacterium]
MDTMNIPLFAAFFAGVASLLSPCVLPLLPSYLAFLGANSDKEKVNSTEQASQQWRLLRNVALFLCGFTTVFVIMGAGASYIGQVFFSYQAVIRKIGAVFMVLLGVQLLGILPIPALQRENRPLLNYVFRGPVGAFIFGVAITAGWTPCIGPILATILMYAGAEGTVTQGAWLLFLYAMGFCLPFLLLAFLYSRFATRFSRLYAWLPWIHRLSGVVIILAGVAIYFGFMNALQAMLTNYYDGY